MNLPSSSPALQQLLRYRLFLVILIQLVLVIASYVASFVLRLDLDFMQVPFEIILRTLPILILVRLISLSIFRLHQGMWRYVSVVDLTQIIKATTVSSVAFTLIMLFIFGVQGFPRSVFLIDWAGNIFLLSGIRLAVRLARQQFMIKNEVTDRFQRLLIVGAGDAGAALCAQALTTPAFRYVPAAFVDDDPSNVGTSILGVPVAGHSNNLAEVVREYRIDFVVITMPTSTPTRLRELVDACQRENIPFRVLPATSDIIDGTVSISRIREVNPIDLMGRQPAKLDQDLIKRFIEGKRILVTGAAGSVGSELVRQISVNRPELLILVDRAENALFFLESEIGARFPDIPFVAQVCDIVDQEELADLMRNHRPQVVFHAAAHKHVPLLERAPREAVKNNIGGTFAVAEAAIAAGVERFILISTDKAVNPSSVMGATKRVAEKIIQDMNSESATRFSAVRFGNVIGSNASVVPLFKRQIAEGGPVTVTHPDAERYFMSISEAAGLVLEAGAIGEGGEIFVLDMGDPVKIVTLAEGLIRLSGLTPHEEIEIIYTGLRPGEKLTEELHVQGEQFQSTVYDKIFMLKDECPYAGVSREVESLLKSFHGLGPEGVKASLKKLVPEYSFAEPAPVGAEERPAAL